MAGKKTVHVLRNVRRTDRERSATDDELANPKIAIAALLLLVLLPVVSALVFVWILSKTLTEIRNRVAWE